MALTGNTVVHTCHRWDEAAWEGEAGGGSCQCQVEINFYCCWNVRWKSFNKFKTWIWNVGWKSLKKTTLEFEMFQERNPRKFPVLLSGRAPWNHIRKTRRNLPGAQRFETRFRTLKDFITIWKWMIQRHFVFSVAFHKLRPGKIPTRWTPWQWWGKRMNVIMYKNSTF